MILLLSLLACAGLKERAVRDAMDRIWNKGDLSVIDRAYTPELAAEVRRFVTENRSLYPDISVSIDRVVARGDIIVTQWTVAGTHRDLNTPVKVSGVSVRRLEGRVFVEETLVYDLKSVYDQLGFRVVPPPGVTPFDTPSVVSGGAPQTAPVIDASLFPAPSGRYFSHQALVGAPRAEVFRLLSTAEGWKAFMGIEARIDLRVGGRYEILFAGPEAGEGNRGCEGCQVLGWVPDSTLVFSWNAPPSFPEERGQRTFVVVQLADAPEGTRVTLQHAGFGSGGRWDEVYAYFDAAWPQVLAALADRYPPPEKKGRRGG